jgi:protein-S-isoprenylcysteine O-methyltransferase Ste14
LKARGTSAAQGGVRRKECLVKNFLRYSSSFIAPVLVCIVFPIIFIYEKQCTSGLPLFPDPWLAAFGGALIAGGTALALISFRLIMRIGEGTIMPWDPSRKLVVVSLYGYVRNPMILGVLIVLVGEALAFSSVGIGMLALFFFVVNTAYFMLSEERGLEKRFGEEYREYKRNVPRWVPRVTPWRPGKTIGSDAAGE